MKLSFNILHQLSMESEDCDLILTLYSENSCQYGCLFNLKGDFVNFNELVHIMDSSHESIPTFRDQS